MRATTKTVLSLTATIGVAVALAGCGGAGNGSAPSSTSSPMSSSSMSSSSTSSPSMSSSGSASSTSSSAAAPTKVTIKNFMFAIPGPVAPGAKVMVTNSDTTNHTFTLKAAGVDAKAEAGRTVTFTAPTKPGSYKVTCDYHANMSGTLVVK